MLPVTFKRMQERVDTRGTFHLDFEYRNTCENEVKELETKLSQESEKDKLPALESSLAQAKQKLAQAEKDLVQRYPLRTAAVSRGFLTRK